MRALRIKERRQVDTTIELTYELDGGEHSVALKLKERGEELTLAQLHDRVMRCHTKRVDEGAYLDPRDYYTGAAMKELWKCSEWTVTRAYRGGLLKCKVNPETGVKMYAVQGWCKLTELQSQTTRKEALRASLDSNLEIGQEKEEVRVDLLMSAFDRHNLTLSESGARALRIRGEELGMSEETLAAHVESQLTNNLRRDPPVKTILESLKLTARAPRKPEDKAAPRVDTSLVAAEVERCFLKVIKRGEGVVESVKEVRRVRVSGQDVQTYLVESAAWQSASGQSVRTSTEVAVMITEDDDAFTSHNKITRAYLNKITISELSRAKHKFDGETSKAVAAQVDKWLEV